MLLDLKSSRLGFYNPCQNPDTSIYVACTPLPIIAPQVPNTVIKFLFIVSCSQKLKFSSRILSCPSTTIEECVMCPWSIYHTSLWDCSKDCRTDGISSCLSLALNQARHSDSACLTVSNESLCLSIWVVLSFFAFYIYHIIQGWVSLSNSGSSISFFRHNR